jgi:hypothetical protein
MRHPIRGDVELQEQTSSECFEGRRKNLELDNPRVALSREQGKVAIDGQTPKNYLSFGSEELRNRSAIPCARSRRRWGVGETEASGHFTGGFEYAQMPSRLALACASSFRSFSI